jgi:hypothetical protein
MSFKITREKPGEPDHIQFGYKVKKAHPKYLSLCYNVLCSCANEEFISHP